MLNPITSPDTRQRCVHHRTRRIRRSPADRPRDDDHARCAGPWRCELLTGRRIADSRVRERGQAPAVHSAGCQLATASEAISEPDDASLDIGEGARRVDRVELDRDQRCGSSTPMRRNGDVVTPTVVARSSSNRRAGVLGHRRLREERRRSSTSGPSGAVGQRLDSLAAARAPATAGPCRPGTVRRRVPSETGMGAGDLVGRDDVEVGVQPVVPTLQTRVEGRIVLDSRRSCRSLLGMAARHVLIWCRARRVRRARYSGQKLAEMTRVIECPSG